MDYVVFGIGFGATILVLGLLVRDLGPHLRFRESSDGDDVLHAEELVGKIAWTRFCVALGSVLAIVGALFVVATITCMVLVLSDETGQWVMLGTLATTLVIVLFWTWAYFDRFGSYGILPERRRVREAPVPEIEPVRPTVTPVVGPVLPATEERPTAASAADERVEVEAPATIDLPAAVASGDPIKTEAEAADTTLEAQPAETVAEDDDSTDDTETRLPTPEERLARAESPVNHGSAEGDLGIASTRPKRPTPRIGRQPRAATEPTGTTSDSGEATESDKPAEQDARAADNGASA